MASTVPSGGVHSTAFAPPVPDDVAELVAVAVDVLVVPPPAPSVLEDVTLDVALLVEPPAPGGVVSVPPQP
jgi:hypothetical protein